MKLALNPMAKYIVYACPMGALAEQIQSFFEESQKQFGVNTAHQYMPHCSLTGFFEDRSSAAAVYTQTLDRAYRRACASQPSPALVVKDFNFCPDWHGLELESLWLRQLIVNFACTAISPTRKGVVRPKPWLHLSLAYDFAPSQANLLSSLAVEMIDPRASVDWQLRYYQRNSNSHWICHRAWSLAGS